MANFESDLANAKDLGAFLSARLFDATPHVFGANREAYLSWKAEIARAIEVDPYSLLMIGSAAVGVSMDEGKWFSRKTRAEVLEKALASSWEKK